MRRTSVVPVANLDVMDLTFDELEVARSKQPFTLRTLEEIERIIAGVARSIEALDNGSYGQCEQCGASLRAEVLVADPLALRCDAHLVRERPALFLADGADSGDGVAGDATFGVTTGADAAER
jgi:hypothetical protein